MNILWLTEFFPESEKGEITGGVESRCFFVRKHLSALGEKVEIIGKRTNGKRWAHLTFKTIPIGIIFYLQIIRDTFFAFRKTKKFDIVEGTNYTTYPLAWIIGKITGAKIVYWYPDVFLGNWIKNIGWIGIIGEITERITLRMPADSYTAISKTTKDKLVSAGIDANKITIIYCGVDTDEIEEVKKTTPHIKKYDLCLANRLVAYKKTDVALAAVAKLIGSYPKLKCVIVGQGPEKNRLEYYVEKNNLGKNVLFTGYVDSHIEVLRIMFQSKIFCLPSSAEGFGISPIESSALGTPAIVSDIPVLKEISEAGKTGGLFKEGDSLDLANIIKSLFEGEMLYKHKIATASRLAKKYTWSQSAKRTVVQYRNLLKCK